MDNIAALMHFLFAQTKQQYICSGLLLLIAYMWPCEMQWLGGCQGTEIGLSMCKATYRCKYLLYCVVVLYCGLKPSVATCPVHG